MFTSIVEGFSRYATTVVLMNCRNLYMAKAGEHEIWMMKPKLKQKRRLIGLYENFTAKYPTAATTLLWNRVTLLRLYDFAAKLDAHQDD